MLYIAIYLTVDPSSGGDESPSARRAAIGAIVFIYFTGVGWAMGWNSIQYLINAEVFPLRVRALGSSLLMCFHYANRYGLSKVCISPPAQIMDFFEFSSWQKRLFHPCYSKIRLSPKGHFGSFLPWRSWVSCGRGFSSLKQLGGTWKKPMSCLLKYYQLCPDVYNRCYWQSLSNIQTWMCVAHSSVAFRPTYCWQNILSFLSLSLLFSVLLFFFCV